MRICARVLWTSDRIAFAMIDSDPTAYGPHNGYKARIVTELHYSEVRPDSEIPQSFSLRKDEAQYLMDELWNCGLRPSEGSGSAGAMAAVQAHLSDMRKLVFESDK